MSQASKTSEKRPRRSFTEEFKRDAANLVAVEGYSFNRAALAVGVSAQAWGACSASKHHRHSPSRATSTHSATLPAPWAQRCARCTDGSASAIDAGSEVCWAGCGGTVCMTPAPGEVKDVGDAPGVSRALLVTWLEGEGGSVTKVDGDGDGVGVPARGGEQRWYGNESLRQRHQSAPGKMSIDVACMLPPISAQYVAFHRGRSFIHTGFRIATFRPASSMSDLSPGSSVCGMHGAQIPTRLSTIVSEPVVVSCWPNAAIMLGRGRCAEPERETVASMPGEPRSALCS